MHVPRGRPVHENLSTSYVNLAALLAELQVNEFTGYVSVNFWNYEGYVFLDGGHLINAYEQSDGTLKRGREAIDSILSRSQARGGAVSFFIHPDDVVRALAGIINGEIVYRELASEFTHLERLVEKLKKAPDSTWYIEVALERDTGAGVIYIIKGQAEAVASIRETPESGDLHTTCGQEGLAVLFSQVNTYGGTFNVYRALGTTSLIASPPNSAAQNSAVQVAAPATAPVLVLPAQASLAMVATASLSSGSPRLINGTVAPDPHQEPQIVDALEEEEPPANPTLDTPGSPVTLTNEQYSELVNLMGEVIAAVERGTAEVVRESDFRMVLREAFIHAAEHYPFLDPFAGEFEYSSGEIVFLGAARPADFVVGLSQALRWTVDDLVKRVPEANLRGRVEAMLNALQQNRQTDFEKFGLEVALEEILGH